MVVLLDQFWYHPFSTYAKRMRTYAYHGVRNVSFSEHFAYILNGGTRIKGLSLVILFEPFLIIVFSILTLRIL